MNWGAALTRKRTHYDNLQVARTASPEVIKAAYRSLSAKYHPDRNPGDQRCARIMAIINEAYAVLSDPVRRRQHDAWIDAFTDPPEPDFYQACGGARSNDQQGDRPGSDTSETKMSQWATRSGQRSRSEPLELNLAARAGVVVVLLGIIGLLIYFMQPGQMNGRSNYNPNPTAEPSWPADEWPKTEQEPEAETQGNTVPKAPNGSEWPTSAGYVDGFPRLRTSGHSTVTVDNSENSADVFVKLVELGFDESSPIRHIYIPKHGTFTMRSVPPGRYDVRYQDLADGALARTEEFELTAVEDDEGVSFNNVTMTLFKVANGNMETYSLDPSEF